MTRSSLILLAAFGSAALLIGAWTFQYFGYAPCKLCFWQRYPHMAAVLIGASALAIRTPFLPLLAGLSAATSGAIGVYHTGVEKKWWEGPSSCSSGSTEGLSVEDLLNQINSAPLIRCDEVAWQFLGLSMASWNAVLSFALAGLWLVIAWRFTVKP